MTNSSTSNSCFPALITPDQYAALLPSTPISSSAERGWQGITLQHFRLGPTDISYPAAGDHRLGLHLAGLTLVEQVVEGHRERLWSDSGYANLIPAGVPVSKSVKGQPDLLLLHLNPTLVEEVVNDLEINPTSVSLIPSIGRPDEAIDRLGRLLLAEAETGSPTLGSRLLADMLTRSLTVQILRRFSSMAQRNQFQPADTMAGWRLRRVIEHMHAHLAENLPLATLAAVSGLSSTHFARAFRAAVGEPPHRHLIRLRIREACSLLERTKLPITEIAIRCGFEQANHFATMFRQLTGVSPRAYRKARST